MLFNYGDSKFLSAKIDTRSDYEKKKNHPSPPEECCCFLLAVLGIPHRHKLEGLARWEGLMEELGISLPP